MPFVLFAGISAAAAVLQTAVLAYTLWYVRSQLREAHRAQGITASIFMLDRLQVQEARMRRDDLYNRIASRIDHPTPSDVHALIQLANEFSALGFLVRHGLVEPEFVYAMHYASVFRVWHVMEPWIRAERTRRGVYYAEDFEQLVEKASEYMRRKRPGEIVLLNGSTVFPAA